MKKFFCLFALVLPVAALTQVPASNVQSNPGLAPPPAIYESGLAKLQDQLNLTDTERGYWNAYVARMEAYSKTYYEEKPVSAYAAEPGPRQIGRLADGMQNRLAALEDIEDAAKALYAVLSPEQKTIADQLMPASVPVFAVAGSINCPVPSDKKGKADNPSGMQRGHRGGGGVGPAMGGM